MTNLITPFEKKKNLIVKLGVGQPLFYYTPVLDLAYCTYFWASPIFDKSHNPFRWKLPYDEFNNPFRKKIFKRVKQGWYTPILLYPCFRPHLLYLFLGLAYFSQISYCTPVLDLAYCTYFWASPIFDKSHNPFRWKTPYDEFNNPFQKKI